MVAVRCPASQQGSTHEVSAEVRPKPPRPRPARAGRRTARPEPRARRNVPPGEVDPRRRGRGARRLRLRLPRAAPGRRARAGSVPRRARLDHALRARAPPGAGLRHRLRRRRGRPLCAVLARRGPVHSAGPRPTGRRARGPDRARVPSRGLARAVGADRCLPRVPCCSARRALGAAGVRTRTGRARLRSVAAPPRGCAPAAPLARCWRCWRGWWCWCWCCLLNRRARPPTGMRRVGVSRAPGPDDDLRGGRPCQRLRRRGPPAPPGARGGEWCFGGKRGVWWRPARSGVPACARHASGPPRKALSLYVETGPPLRYRSGSTARGAALRPRCGARAPGERGSPHGIRRRPWPLAPCLFRVNRADCRPPAGPPRQIQILSRTSELLALRLLLPPPRTAGMLNVTLSPAHAPPGLAPGDFALQFALRVPQVNPCSRSTNLALHALQTWCGRVARSVRVGPLPLTTCAQSSRAPDALVRARGAAARPTRRLGLAERRDRGGRRDAPPRTRGVPRRRARRPARRRLRRRPCRRRRGTLGRQVRPATGTVRAATETVSDVAGAEPSGPPRAVRACAPTQPAAAAGRAARHGSPAASPQCGLPRSEPFELFACRG